MADLFDPSFTILDLEDGAISDLSGSPPSMVSEVPSLGSEGPSMDSEGLSEPAHDTTDSAPDTTYSTPPGKAPSRARQPAKRTVFSRRQLATLESRFCQQSFLSREERKEFADELSITERQVMIWFQNRRGRLKKRGPTDKAFNPCKLDELNARRPYPLLYGMISSLNYHNPSAAQQLISMYPQNVQQTAQSALNYTGQPQHYNGNQGYNPHRNQWPTQQTTAGPADDTATIARLLSYQQKTQPQVNPPPINDGLLLSKYSSDPYKLQQCLLQTLQKERGTVDPPSILTPSQTSQWNNPTTRGSIPDRVTSESTHLPNVSDVTKGKEDQPSSVTGQQSRAQQTQAQKEQQEQHEKLLSMQQQHGKHQQPYGHHQQHHSQHQQHHGQHQQHPGLPQQGRLLQPAMDQRGHCQRQNVPDLQPSHQLGIHKPEQPATQQTQPPSHQQYQQTRGYPNYDYASLRYAAQYYYQPGHSYDYSALQCSTMNNYTSQAPTNAQPHPLVM